MNEQPNNFNNMGQQPMYDPNTGQPMMQQPVQQPMMQQPIQPQPMMQQPIQPQPVQQPMQPQPAPVQQPMMQQPTPNNSKLKQEGKPGGMIIGVLISIVVFFVAFDLFIIPIPLRGLEKSLELNSGALILKDAAKYASNVALFLFVAFFIRYGCNVLISFFATRNSFRNKYLSINNQKTYILFTSIFAAILNIAVIVYQRSIIANMIEEISVYENFEFVQQIISKCEMMQIFNILIGLLACVISIFVVYRTTKKRNEFVTQ